LGFNLAITSSNLTDLGIYLDIILRLQSSFLNSMTGHLRSGAKADELRDFTDATIIGVEAAAVENAPGGKIDGCGDFTF
jgi:hypothetical protein